MSAASGITSATAPGDRASRAPVGHYPDEEREAAVSRRATVSRPRDHRSSHGYTVEEYSDGEVQEEHTARGAAHRTSAVSGATTASRPRTHSQSLSGFHPGGQQGADKAQGASRRTTAGSGITTASVPGSMSVGGMQPGYEADPSRRTTAVSAAGSFVSADLEAGDGGAHSPFHASQAMVSAGGLPAGGAAEGEGRQGLMQMVQANNILISSMASALDAIKSITSPSGSTQPSVATVGSAIAAAAPETLTVGPGARPPDVKSGTWGGAVSGLLTRRVSFAAELGPMSDYSSSAASGSGAGFLGSAVPSHHSSAVSSAAGAGASVAGRSSEGGNSEGVMDGYQVLLQPAEGEGDGTNRSPSVDAGQRVSAGGLSHGPRSSLNAPSSPVPRSLLESLRESSVEQEWAPGLAAGSRTARDALASTPPRERASSPSPLQGHPLPGSPLDSDAMTVQSAGAAWYSSVQVGEGGTARGQGGGGRGVWHCLAL